MWWCAGGGVGSSIDVHMLVVCSQTVHMVCCTVAVDAGWAALPCCYPNFEDACRVVLLPLKVLSTALLEAGNSFLHVTYTIHAGSQYNMYLCTQLALFSLHETNTHSATRLCGELGTAWWPGHVAHSGMQPVALFIVERGAYIYASRWVGASSPWQQAPSFVFVKWLHLSVTAGGTAAVDKTMH